jgi:multiple sugar transport system permease protein
MRKLRKNRTAVIVSYIILIFAALTTVFPFYWMVTCAFKSATDILKVPPDIIPQTLTLKNMNKFLAYGNVGRSFLNTAVISLSVVVGTLFTSSLAAYAFTKIHFSHSKKIYGVFIGTLMIPSQLTLIPLYMIFSRLHFQDTYWPLILPTVLINAYGIFLIRSFMESIPDSYIESASIDGANPFVTYSRVVLPLCKPVLITLGLFSFIGAWNDFMGALIYIDSTDKFTITLLLNAFRGRTNLKWGEIMAGSTISIIPIVIFYLFSQKFFVEGIALTGIKG